MFLKYENKWTIFSLVELTSSFCYLHPPFPPPDLELRSLKHIEKFVESFSTIHVFWVENVA